MKREEYNYWLSNVKNIGPRKIELLLQSFISAEEVFRAGRRELEKFRNDCRNIDSAARFFDSDIEELLKEKDQEKIQENYAKLEKHGIYFVSKEDVNYPGRLKQIYGAPFALYVKGKLPSDESRTLAVVGARDCSPYGMEMAKYLTGAAAKEGIIIISGLARGIDSHAHEGALGAGGKTVGILGCGIDICYPKENINLYMEMQKDGAILSEYPPGTKPLASNFPMRNRIISGMSDGILVIEAKEKSGSLITVDMGLEQGKDIYAVPGKATDRLSCGCNNLIKMGAKLVTTPKDILEDFIPEYMQKKDELKTKNNLLETDGKIVYASLCLEPKHIEEIAMETGLSMDIILEQLLLLELRGMARQTMRNYYIAIE